MSDTDRVYRLTSIGRPVVPSVRTNLAILVLMPIGALLYAAVGAWQGAAPGVVAASAITGLLVVFGAWALTRELAPDDNAAAFVAVLFAFAALIAYREVSLLLLFTTMFLVRIVNRSTGLAPRLHDSVLVLALALWCAWSLSMPMLTLVAAAAFALDARLAGGRTVQLCFAAAAVIAFVLLLFTPEGLSLTISLTLDRRALVLAVIAVAYVVVIGLTGPMQSVGDATGVSLDTGRVRAGMLVGLLVPLLVPLTAPDRGDFPVLAWACLAAVAVSGLVMRLARTSKQNTSDG